MWQVSSSLVVSEEAVEVEAVTEEGTEVEAETPVLRLSSTSTLLSLPWWLCAHMSLQGSLVEGGLLVVVVLEAALQMRPMWFL